VCERTIRHGRCPLRLQDIAALTLARDLRNLRLAQRSGAYSPRLPGVAAGPPDACGSWPPSGEWSGRAEWMRFARLIHRPGRLLGVASARAASGGNLSLTWSSRRVMRHRRAAAVGRRPGRAPAGVVHLPTGRTSVGMPAWPGRPESGSRCARIGTVSLTTWSRLSLSGRRPRGSEGRHLSAPWQVSPSLR
jgi:hypothetical protein